jgi:hypothetical protein
VRRLNHGVQNDFITRQRCIHFFIRCAAALSQAADNQVTTECRQHPTPICSS